MPDIDLVIKIDEKYFNDIKECVKEGYVDYEPWVKIANGKPLTKGHKRLIEESEIDTVINGVLNTHELYSSKTFLNIIHKQCLSTIEADKAESEGK